MTIKTYLTEEIKPNQIIKYTVGRGVERGLNYESCIHNESIENLISTVNQSQRLIMSGNTKAHVLHK